MGGILRVTVIIIENRPGHGKGMNPTNGFEVCHVKLLDKQTALSVKIRIY